MALHQVAQALLASRGIQPTPENMSRAIAALEANPELAQRIAAGAQRGTSEQGEITQQNPVAAALADPFDVALAKAMNGEQLPVAVEAASVAAGAVTQPAPPIVPVDQLALEETVPQVPSPVGATPPSPIGQLPSGHDAAAQVAAAAEIQGAGDEDGLPDFPIPIIPAPAGRSTGTALVPAERAAAQVGTQGALPSTPPRLGQQRALSAPQGALTGPQKALSASEPTLSDNPVRQKKIRLAFPENVTVTADDIFQMHAEAIGRGDIPAGQHTQDINKALSDLEGIGQIAQAKGKASTSGSKVEADIGRTIDAQDAPIRKVSETRIEFDMGPDHVVMDKNGMVAVTSPGGELAQVRDPAILERIRRFLKRYGAEFKTFARLL